MLSRRTWSVRVLTSASSESPTWAHAMRSESSSTDAGNALHMSSRSRPSSHEMSCVAMGSPPAARLRRRRSRSSATSSSPCGSRRCARTSSARDDIRSGFAKNRAASAGGSPELAPMRRRTASRETASPEGCAGPPSISSRSASIFFFRFDQNQQKRGNAPASSWEFDARVWGRASRCARRTSRCSQIFFENIGGV